MKTFNITVKYTISKMYNQPIPFYFEHFEETGNVNGAKFSITKQKNIYKKCARQINRLANWRLKGHNCTYDLNLVEI